MFIVLNFIFNIVTAKDKGIELFNDKKFAEAVDYYKTVLEAVSYTHLTLPTKA